MLRKISRTSQNVLEVEFTFDVEDTMVNASGVEQNFGLTTTLAGVFDIAEIPPGATILAGHVVTEEAFDTAGYDIKIGDADDDDRYLGSTDRAAAGITELVPTGYVTTGQKLRLTYASDDACTAGRMTIRALFSLAGRASEVS
jgi:hypothetical protein